MSPRVLAALALLAGLGLGLPAPASDDLRVEFEYRGESRVIEGRKAGPRRFLFNEGGSPSIRIATLDWPPYIGRDICRQGWVQQLTVALLASQGYAVESVFYPWARAVRMTEIGRADMLYPEYFIEPDAGSDVHGHEGTNRRDHLYLSEAFPGGPIAFMRRVGEDIPFDGDLRSLKDERIGVVRGYQNTPEFDRLMAEGFFNIDAGKDDIENARKLAGERINLLIGDPAVVQFAVANADMPESQRERIIDRITTVDPLIQYNHLYYAIARKGEHGERLRRDMDLALAEFERSGEMFRIIEDTSEACGYEVDATLQPYLDEPDDGT